MRAWISAPFVRASLTVLGLERTLAWIDRVPSKKQADRAPIDMAVAERAVARALRLQPGDAACLPRSLVQYLLHRRDGVPARLVIGVRKRPFFEAHAWVEDPLAARSMDGFGPLYVREAP